MLFVYGLISYLKVFNSITRMIAAVRIFFLLQAMYDTLLDPISDESFSSGCPSATVLRGVYSLLGEGGTQFPSLVLDMDSAQT